MSQVDRRTSHSPSCLAPQSKEAGIFGALSRRLLGRVLCSWAWVSSPFLTRQLPGNRERWPGLGHMPDQNAWWTVRQGPPEPCGVECSWREGSPPEAGGRGGRAHGPQCPLCWRWRRGPPCQHAQRQLSATLSCLTLLPWLLGSCRH